MWGGDSIPPIKPHLSSVYHFPINCSSANLSVDYTHTHTPDLWVRYSGLCCGPCDLWEVFLSTHCLFPRVQRLWSYTGLTVSLGTPALLGHILAL